MTRIKDLLIFALTAVVFLVPAIKANSVPGDDKLTTEEILAKHLESIGSKEARAGLKTLTVLGKAQAVAKGRSAGETTGIVVLASDGVMNMIGMKFNNNDYPGERMGFDGKDFTVGWQTQGVRSILGEFMLFNSKAFESGILGGTLSTGWSLLNYDEDKGELKCKGTAKIDDVKHHKCSYRPDKGSELSITLYFHPETFRHVRTEYRRVISGGQGLSVDNSTRQVEKRYKFVEDFSDFQDIGGLTMPHQYLMNLEMSVGNGSTDIEWRMDLANFVMNSEIDPTGFKVDN